jgi:SAM-dependent methyltransferase
VTTLVENTPHAWSERALQPAPWDCALWSEAGQVQRFLAVLDHLELREGDSVLDFGCGSGRLCAFLPESVTYHAYDWAPGMLDRVRRDHERAIVYEELPEELFDHVVCVGPFNLRENWTREQTWQRLAQLWTLHTRRTLVVSLYRGLALHSLAYSAGWAAEFVEHMGCERFAIDTRHLANDIVLEMRR